MTGLERVPSPTGAVGQWCAAARAAAAQISVHRYAQGLGQNRVAWPCLTE